jgi:hypothetical protein
MAKSQLVGRPKGCSNVPVSRRNPLAATMHGQCRLHRRVVNVACLPAAAAAAAAAATATAENCSQDSSTWHTVHISQLPDIQLQQLHSSNSCAHDIHVYAHMCTHVSCSHAVCIADACFVKLPRPAAAQMPTCLSYTGMTAASLTAAATC